MKFWQKSLTVKLSTVFLFMSLVTVGVVGYVAWAKTRADLERLVFNQLSISAILKEGELDRWFDDQRQAFLLINQSSEFQSNIQISTLCVQYVISFYRNTKVSLFCDTKENMSI